MKNYRYHIHLHLLAPVLSQAAGGHAHGLDTAALHDSNDEAGVPSLPGSLIRGNLRHAWKYFADILENNTPAEVSPITRTHITQWLGDKSGDQYDSPQRAQLHFSPYWRAQSKVSATGILHRIQIDSDTGSVKPSALQVIETPFAAGEKITFSGYIDTALDPEQAEFLYHWLNKGLRYLPAVGALKGIGFGRIKDVDIDYAEIQIQAQTVFKPRQAAFGICIKPQSEFCIAQHHIRDNNFATQDFIPGGVIKGILAQQVGKEGPRKHEYPQLAKHFDQLRITHAFANCETRKQRPIATPLSLVTIKTAEKYKVYDLALHSQAGLIDRQAPAFAPDWKGEQAQLIAEHCQQAMPPARNIQVRTAINRQDTGFSTLGNARDEALFSMETIQPEGYHWLANVDCHQIPAADRDLVIEQLQQLFSQGLYGLGKPKLCHRGMFA